MPRPWPRTEIDSSHCYRGDLIQRRRERAPPVAPRPRRLSSPPWHHPRRGPPVVMPSLETYLTPSISSSRHLLEEHVISLIQRCSDMRTLRQIHGHFLKYPLPSFFFALSKILAFSALSPSGDLVYARRLFGEMPHPNVFSWNSMIRGCSQVHNPCREPIVMYKQMVRQDFADPNSYTIAFVLKACALVSAFFEGCQIHCHALRYGLDASPFVQTGLLNFYAKCEEISPARLVFDAISDKNLIAWSAMISGYARIGLVNEALDLFRAMQEAGVMPDEVTMVSVISACAKAGALELGKWFHVFIDRKRITVDLELSTALIDMYAKCGSVERAKKVFDEMKTRDTKAWSSMIVGMAIHGLVKEALELFSRMLELKVKPNHVTFIGVLSACAHGGLVDDGRQFWSTMQELEIEPCMEHYGCMVDLLCRSGLLDEAYSFVASMPILPNSIIWRTLLVACKNSQHFDKAEAIAERLLELEPLNAENYVLLSNLYATSSQWEKVSYMRKQMKDHGVKVVPGCSSIEIDGFLHKFVVSDDTHPEIKEIREVLRDVAERVQLAGHKPRTSAVLHDVGEEEKEGALCEHSERLAIAYGLLRTKAPHIIRVVKNLRFCADCHEVTKIISEAYDREIVVRDRIRFHRFVNGTCSCKDFW